MPQCKNSYLKWNSQTSESNTNAHMKSVDPWETSLLLSKFNVDNLSFHKYIPTLVHSYALQPPCAFQLFILVNVQLTGEITYIDFLLELSGSKIYSAYLIHIISWKEWRDPAINSHFYCVPLQNHRVLHFSFPGVYLIA